METVYLTALFIAPGLIGKGLRDSFNKERRNYDNVYDYLLQIVIDSIFVNGLTLALMNFFVIECSDLNKLTMVLQDFSNLAKYICIMLVMTLIWTALKYTKVIEAYVWLKNKILKTTECREHSIHTTVWDDLVNSENLKGTWLVASIYRDENYVTSGMIAQSTSTNGEEFELALDHTDEVEQLKKDHPELFKIEQEYYNTVTGLRIVFYEQSVIQEHWLK